MIILQLLLNWEELTHMSLYYLINVQFTASTV